MAPVKRLTKGTSVTFVIPAHIAKALVSDAAKRRMSRAELLKFILTEYYGGNVMELDDGELRVYYKSREADIKIDEAIDEALENALASLGYRRWASGYSFIKGVRDLAFKAERSEA